MKNGRRSFFSLRDMKAQTSMRSKNEKMSQKSAVQNADPFRKFIRSGKWMNFFGTVVANRNGCKI